MAIYRKLYLAALWLLVTTATLAQRQTLLNHDWKFHKGDVANGDKTTTSDQDWRTVTLPHD